MSRSTISAGLLACVFLQTALSFQAAQIIQLGDRPTWEQVSANVSDVSFAGLGGIGSSIDKSYSNGIQINGVTFEGGPYGSSSADYLIIRTIPNVMYGPPDSDLGCPPPQVPCGNSGAGITVSLPPGVNSVGLSLGSFWPPGPVSIRFPNGQSFTVPNAPLLPNFDSSASAFAGFTSATSLGSFRVEAAGLPIIRALSFGSYKPLSTPFISPGGIVPIYGSTNAVEPGEWITIYGLNLSSRWQLWKGDFPTSLGGTSVTIDGKPAYLWYVSPYQINAQIPDDTARGMVPVVIANSLGTTSSSVKLADYAPSLCLLDSMHVAGIIVRSDGSGAYGDGTFDILGPTGNSLGYSTVAAKAGDNVALFGVGFGPTTLTLPAGQSFSGAAPTANSVRVEIGDPPVVVVTPSFSGVTSAGLYQINLTIPPGAGSGDLTISAIVANAQTQPRVVIPLRRR